MSPDARISVSGSISRLSIKPKVAGEVGLPKHAVPTLRISPAGAEGDYNRYRSTELHGDPEQALLLVTEDLLAQLASEGWPVKPGDLGENLTLRGIPEISLLPGVRLRVGTTEVEVTKPCDPCTELYTLPYVGKERGPVFLKVTKGRRGWYARVNAAGEIHTGASVSLAPPTHT
jgi:MOSC domain-containing protein YiiM